MSVPTAIRNLRLWIREHDTAIEGRTIARCNLLDRQKVEEFLDEIERAWGDDLWEMAHKPFPYHVEQSRDALSLARKCFDEVLRLQAHRASLPEDLITRISYADFKADVALATTAYTSPLLNCNVGTVEEQVDRYDEYCAEHSVDEYDSCAACPLRERGAVCQIVWGQLPYEATQKKEGAK